MRRRVVAIAAGVALVVAAGAMPAAVAAADRATTHQIVIQGLRYAPETLKVRRGDVVVWINRDPFPHTVTAAGGFDSGSISAGKSWRYTARRAGVHRYVCTLHSTMSATLEVE